VQKVQTVKDLSIIWDAPAGLPPPVKIMPPPPLAILTDDPTTVPGYDPTKPPLEAKQMIYTSIQLMPEVPKEANVEADRTGYFATPEVKLDDPIPGLSAGSATGTVNSVLPTPSSGLYSALNTLLLDDSALKAHLQPHNHLTLPEYTADLRARDLRRRDALDALMQATGGGLVEGDAEEVTEESLAEPGGTTQSDGSSERKPFVTPML
jgi:hypothetical protein